MVQTISKYQMDFSNTTTRTKIDKKFHFAILVFTENFILYRLTVYVEINN